MTPPIWHPRPTIAKAPRRAALVPLGGAAVAAALGLWAPAAAAATASGVLASSKTAIGKQVGVHLVVTSENGSSSEVLTGDLGKTEGEETITEGKAKVSLRVTRAAGYISGNSAGLTTIFGLTAAQVKKVGSRWVSLASSSSEYTALASDTSVSSVTGALPGTKGTTLSTTTSKGAKLYVLHWVTAASSSTPKMTNSLTVAASGDPLPVQEVSSSSKTKETAGFSRWGERVTVSSPPAGSTVAYSKLG